MRDLVAMRRYIVFGSLVLLVLCCGCTEEPVTNVYITEESDTYTVSGRALSYPGNQLIAGAEYTILAGNQTGICDQNGYFEVSNLSPGIYQVILEAPGHTSSNVTINLSPPPNKSNINQYRDFYLIENTGEINLTVHGQDTGEILSGVTVEVAAVEFPDGLYSHRIDPGSLSVGGITDANGQVTLTGLPAAEVWISALAHDADGDDEPDYGMELVHFRLLPGVPASGHLVMPAYVGGLPWIVATNLPEGYSPPVISPSLYFIFSVPMLTTGGNAQVTLRQDNSPYLDIPLTATWTSSIRLEVTPNEPLTDANMDYDFTLIATSEAGQPISTYKYSIYWQTGSDPVGGTCEEVITDLVAESPSGDTIDFNTRNIMLTWSAVSCAGGYRIYARDDRNNPEWVFLKDEPTDYEAGTIATVCSLPQSFDRYDVDGIQTPFAGTEVTFCVVPLHALVASPGDPHGTVVLSDGHPPAMMSVTQIGDGVNNSGGTDNLEFGVTFSEYIDPSVADPVIEVTEMGGDPAFALDPASATWIWYAGRFSGRFVFEIPAGANASGDEIRITINDLADLSGNTIAGPYSTDWQTVEIWGGIFDFESSPQGWTQTGEGWAWGTPTIGPGGAHESLRCWGLSLDMNYGDSWNTNLLSPEFVVPGVSPYLQFWCWYSLDRYDDYVRVYISNGVDEVELGYFNGFAENWSMMSYHLTQFAGQTVHLRFQFTSDTYDTYPGFFLDDVVIGTLGN